MKLARLLAAVILVLALASFSHARGGGGGGHGGGHSGGSVSVRGYTRSNGTYVAPYTRHAPGTAPSSSSGSSYSPGQSTWSSGRDNSWEAPPPGTKRYTSHHISGLERGRDSHGRFVRSSSAKTDFKHEHPCPSTGMTSGACPGYVIDHVIPLKRGGPDAPVNMQWQTIDAAKAKDRWE